LETHESHVSLKIVHFHRFQIHPDDGSNCIMIGRRADVLTDSSMRSSKRFCVDACSMIASGVVSTMCLRVVVVVVVPVLGLLGEYDDFFHVIVFDVAVAVGPPEMDAGENVLPNDTPPAAAVFPPLVPNTEPKEFCCCCWKARQPNGGGDIIARRAASRWRRADTRVLAVAVLRATRGVAKPEPFPPEEPLSDEGIR